MTDDERKEQLEAAEIIKREYPEYSRQVDQCLKDGSDLVEFLSVLNSFY